MIKYGLKEIILINSGSFIHDKINVADSTLFLGSSGTGKTSILSIATFFYTLNTDKARPDKQQLKFFDWHLATQYSHIIYRYTNSIGDIAFIMSRDEKVRFLFVDLSNCNEDLETLYFGEDNTPLSHKDIKSKLLNLNLEFYSADSLNVAKKVLHKNEYPSFSTKQKPLLDFSLFRNMKDSKEFSEHLYKIYKSSTVKDSSIKQLLISLISDDERKLDLMDLKNGLKSSLKSIAEIETINSKRERILELDSQIVKLEILNQEKNERNNEILTVINNKETLDAVIENNDIELKTQEKRIKEELSQRNKQRTAKLDEINQEISSLIRFKKDTLDEQAEYVGKKKIDVLLVESDKREEYEKESSLLSTKIKAMGADIEKIDEEESSAKKSKKIELQGLKQEDEIKNKKEDGDLKDEKISLLESIHSEIESKTTELAEQQEKVEKDLSELKAKILVAESWISEAPNRELKSNRTLNLNAEIAHMQSQKTSLTQETEELTHKISVIDTQRENANRKSTEDRDSVASEYYDNRNRIDESLKACKKRLKMGDNNLFSYLGENSHPQAKNILAVANEEVLFSENINFEYVGDASTLYGFNISGDMQHLYDKYDVNLINREIDIFNQERENLVAKHNRAVSAIDDEVSKRDKKHKNERLVLKRELNEKNSTLQKVELNLNNRSAELVNELERIKKELEQEIIDKKLLRDSDNKKCLALEEYLDEIKEKKASIESNIKREYKEKIDSINKRLNEIDLFLQGIDEKYKTYLEEAFKLIKDVYDKIRKDKNIDNSLLNALKKEYDACNKKLASIRDNKAWVLYYIETLRPNINKLAETEQNIINKREEIEKVKKTIAKLIDSLNIEYKSISENMKRWAESKKIYNNFMKNAFAFEEVHVRDVYTEKEARSLLVSNSLESKLTEFLKKQNDIDSMERDIKDSVHTITRGVKQGNILNLKTQEDIDIASMDSINEYITVGMGYISYVKEKLDTESVLLQLKSLSEIINGADAKLQYIKTDINLISNEVRNVNKTIKEGVSNFKVIDFIQLNFYSYSSDEVVQKIESISNDLNENYSLLFNSDDTAKKIRDEIINKAKEILKLLEYATKKYISVSDLSILSFDVGQNGNRHMGLTSLETIGSNGTSIMIRTITYLTLLKRVSLKLSGLSDMTYHCILDEIGQISADYFNELLNYTKSLGFAFLNGSASNDEDIISCYKNFYTGIKIENNKTEMLEFENMEM